ncbi:unnamed protein product, partial [Rotaria sordida]
ATSDIEQLIGIWEYVDGARFDDCKKEISVGFALRQSAKFIKPKLSNCQNGD